MSHPLSLTFDQLPTALPVFPLRRVVLLPNIPLELNVYEPRYLHLVQEAMKQHRLMGIIQPLTLETAAKPRPPLLAVGCAARIIQFEETEDARFRIVVAGVCRFGITRELPMSPLGFRRIRPNWAPFEADMHPAPTPTVDWAQLQQESASFMQRHDCAMDWSAVQSVPASLTLDYLSCHLPFAPEDKQWLLESPTHAQRLETLRALFRAHSQNPAGSSTSAH